MEPLSEEGEERFWRHFWKRFTHELEEFLEHWEREHRPHPPGTVTVQVPVSMTGVTTPGPPG